MSVLDFIKHLGADVGIGSQPQAPHSALPMYNFNVNPETVNVAGQKAAFAAAQPLGYNAWQGLSADTPRPIQDAVGTSQFQRYNNAYNSVPVQPNHAGALPPAMVNVPWSSQQVPYAQSLNGPPTRAAQRQSIMEKFLGAF